MNLGQSGRDSCTTCFTSGGLSGELSVTTIRPNETDPILGGKPQPQSLGKLLLRFVLLLAVAIAILAIAWSR
jgi:uncharacterized membrane protein YkgB